MTTLDEFTAHRYDQIAVAFVDIYTKENKLLAAKMVAEEQVPSDHYPLLKERIDREFLKRGYSFETKDS
jgi:SOS response regulatory protein OraA/RecX